MADEASGDPDAMLKATTTMCLITLNSFLPKTLRVMWAGVQVKALFKWLEQWHCTIILSCNTIVPLKNMVLMHIATQFLHNCFFEIIILKTTAWVSACL